MILLASSTVALAGIAMLMLVVAAGWMGARLATRSIRTAAGDARTATPEAPHVIGHSLADDLDAAIVRGQLLIEHQPKLRARSNAIDSVETLVRWRHPERGLIGPNDFIGVAEERGEIRRITEWVVGQTIVEQRSLAACGHQLGFNVNLSARLLADRDFAVWLLDTAREASGPIGIEITETAMIADPAGALRNLHLFADAGLRIAIDDYGAGLSSLAYLKQLPAHELKIDRMFISGLSTSHRDPLLVRSTIDLAHALDTEVTAEGVDSAAAMALLRVMGVDLMQGYLISRPLGLGALRAFLDSRATEDATPAPMSFPWTQLAADRASEPDRPDERIAS